MFAFDPVKKRVLKANASCFCQRKTRNPWPVPYLYGSSRQALGLLFKNGLPMAVAVTRLPHMIYGSLSRNELGKRVHLVRAATEASKEAFEKAWVSCGLRRLLSWTHHAPGPLVFLIVFEAALCLDGNVHNVLPPDLLRPRSWA